MLKEDLASKLIQRAELVAQREENEILIERFKRENPHDFSYFAEVQKLEAENIQSKMRIQALRQQNVVIQSWKLEFRETKQKCQESFKRLRTLEKQISTKSTILNDFLEILENFVKVEQLSNLFQMQKELGVEGENLTPLIEELHSEIQFQERFPLEENVSKLNELFQEEHFFIESNSESNDLLGKWQLEVQSFIQWKDKLNEIEQRIAEKEQSLASEESLLAENERKMKDLNSKTVMKSKRAAEEAVNEYLKVNKEWFESIRNSQGEEIYQNKVAETYKKFFDLCLDNCINNIKQYKLSLQTFNELSEKISKNIKCVEKSILPFLKENDELIATYSSSIDNRSDFLEEISLSHTKIKKDIDRLVALKRKIISEECISRGLAKKNASSSRLERPKSQVFTTGFFKEDRRVQMKESASFADSKHVDAFFEDISSQILRESQQNSYFFQDPSENYQHSNNNIDVENFKHRKNIKINLEGTSSLEAKIALIVQKMLIGTQIYKSTQNKGLTERTREFDPFQENRLPEDFGFQVCNFSLHKSLTTFEFRFQKGIADCTLLLDHICRVSVPQCTLDIIAIKNLKIEDIPNTMRETVEKIEKCNFFPFSLILNKGGSLNLVANCYSDFILWTQDLDKILKNKQLLSKLKDRIEG